MDAVEKKMLQDFWDHHIVSVVREARKLAKKYKANDEIVWLGALLHDVSLTIDRNHHDEKSAKIAYDMLIKEGFDKKTAQIVKNIALRHRCRKYKPQTLEEKIVKMLKEAGIKI
ncbi:MAG: hypothetical protein CO140_00395 [Candidatus Moranbacteria bacterium CG_4_9_14_3_um_filter_40_7]|nr:MAG: hypothetical protein COX31_02750 [Candidatus Moranbacteria bacterium CG23_combo_of_CG06-09_8_20_14_all_40_16]PIU80295.1 MAG: hypothetical protein COS71_04095 [Candidatus Moranbacteria bacterium CG06_land_8_20_14_3_00_40_12]PJA88159.1 MAG: hypothetical protein CO140_00395 [Candidatus Moranbacteria bacterium CG_4_9_14_3_um_filter_40_7]